MPGILRASRKLRQAPQLNRFKSQFLHKDKRNADKSRTRLVGHQTCLNDSHPQSPLEPQVLSYNSTLPILQSAIWDDSRWSLPALCLPSRDPSRDLRAARRALDVHRRDNPCPIKRKREARQFEERTVLRVWHPEELRVGCRTPRGT